MRSAAIEETFVQISLDIPATRKELQWLLKLFTRNVKSFKPEPRNERSSEYLNAILTALMRLEIIQTTLMRLEIILTALMRLVIIQTALMRLVIIPTALNEVRNYSK